jgi:predicted TIM-barrel fold metal-dependent hydrolase
VVRETEAADAVVRETEAADAVATLSRCGQRRYGPTVVNAGIVATVDLTLGATAVDRLINAHAAASPNFRGVRYLGGKAEQIPFGSPAVLAALGVLARRGVVFDCNGPETHPLDFAGVLGETGLLGVARRFPTLQIVLDHCGGAVGPTCFGGDPAKRPEWRRCLAQLAGCPNVAVKVGGLQMAANGFPLGPDCRDRPCTSAELAAMTLDIYRTTVRTFGPGRCMFESNFPVDRWGTTYGNLWNCFKRVATALDLDRAERAAIFGGTAVRIYKLGLDLDRV